MNWINIEDEIPEQERLLVYFFDGTGTSLGFYFGRDKEYPSDNDHVFGGNFGWLTGDVTHWAYIPDYPKGFEDHASMNAEYARVLKGDVYEANKEFFKETKKEIKQAGRDIAGEMCDDLLKMIKDRRYE